MRRRLLLLFALLLPIVGHTQTGHMPPSIPSTSPTSGTNTSIEYVSGATYQQGDIVTVTSGSNVSSYLSLAWGNGDTPGSSAKWKVLSSAAAQASLTCPLSNATNICITLPPYNADPTGSNDSTTAFNAAIAALPALGGTIWVPDGVYSLNGSLQDPSGANAVIPMPKLPNNQGYQSYIRIRGLNGANWTNGSGSLTPGSGAVLTTSLSSGNLFGGYDSATGAGYPPFTYVDLSMDNLTILDSNSNTDAVMVNASYLSGFRGQNLLVKTVNPQDGCPNCGADSGGIWMPEILNTVQNYLDNTQVAGFYNNYKLTEHTHGTQVFSVAGHNCLTFDNGSNSSAPSTYVGNSAQVDYSWVSGCVHQVAAGANPMTIHIDTIDFETRYGGTTGGSVDIYDPNNNLHGIVNFLNPYQSDSAHGSTGQCNIAATGATNLQINALACASQQVAASNVNQTGSYTVTSANASHVAVTSTSTTYDNVGYLWNLPSSMGRSFYMGDFNNANSAADNNMFVLQEMVSGSFPFVINSSGDWCFLVPSSSSSPSTCVGALFRMNHDGTTSGFPTGTGGSGTVDTVNSKSPDSNGNVQLAASDVGALPTTGGTGSGNYTFTSGVFTVNQLAVNDPLHNSSSGMKAGSQGDTSCPTPASGISYTCWLNSFNGWALAQNGAPYSPISTLLMPTKNVSAAYTATAGDYVIRANAVSAAFTITLEASPSTGQIHTIKKIDSSANVVTVNGNGHTIDGASTASLSTQYGVLRLQFNGSGWDII